MRMNGLGIISPRAVERECVVGTCVSSEVKGFPLGWETAEEGLERFGFFFGFCSLLIEKLNLALKNERD